MYCKRGGPILRGEALYADRIYVDGVEWIPGRATEGTTQTIVHGSTWESTQGVVESETVDDRGTLLSYSLSNDDFTQKPTITHESSTQHSPTQTLETEPTTFDHSSTEATSLETNEIASRDYSTDSVFEVMSSSAQNIKTSVLKSITESMDWVSDIHKQNISVDLSGSLHSSSTSLYPSLTSTIPDNTHSTHFDSITQRGETISISFGEGFIGLNSLMSRLR